MHEPKLLDQVRTAIRLKHMSLRTEEAYVRWVRRFVTFHEMRHPAEMGAEQVRAFLSYLAAEEDVAASTQNQAFAALLFLYGPVLGKDLGPIASVVRAKRPKRLPVVFTREEVRAVLARMEGTPRIVAGLLYGSGLRLLECLRLRVKDVDFGANEIVVRDGKGAKDRAALLPQRLKDSLRTHLRRMRLQHEEDLRAGYGAVYLPHALGRKYPNASVSWSWQYVFPSGQRSADPRSGEVRRHHIAESTVQKAVREALLKAGVTKPGSCHTFRHSFATHLL
jgi:integron integrase